MENVISKVKLPSEEQVYEIVPQKVGNGTYVASVPTDMAKNDTIALKSMLEWGSISARDSEM